MSETILTLVAHNISELYSCIVKATENFGRSKLWWRGHADSEWSLVPSLFHKNLSKNEQNMSVRFVNYSYPRDTNVSNFHGRRPSDWLFLMRHHGLPCRLLDWSQSPLTALFFCVSDSNFLNKDGILWGISPGHLNVSQNASFDGILPNINPVVNDIFLSAFNPTQKTPPYILSTHSVHASNRQMMQSSEFTIHGIDTPIESMKDSHKFISKIIIPNSCKNDFKVALDFFHITKSHTFPDLDHLAEELSEYKYTKY